MTAVGASRGIDVQPRRSGPEGGAARSLFAVPVATLAATGRLSGLSIVRIVLAALVIFSHSWPLGGFGADPHIWNSPDTLGMFAVAGFLILSGFLVTLSLERMSWGRFAWHRALRLLPGFWLVLLISAFLLGPALYWAAGSAGSYWESAPSPYGYVTDNWWLATRQWSIDHLFKHNPIGVAINGSLWSLRYEAAAYAGLVILAAIAAATAGFSRTRPAARWILIACLAASGAVGLYVSIRAAADPAAPWIHDGPTLPGLGLMEWSQVARLWFAFCCGSIGALTAKRWRLRPLVVGAAAAGLLIGFGFSGAYYVLVYPALVVLLASAGAFLNGPAGRWCSRHDASYGTYLYGFPVQQTLVAGGFTTVAGPWLLAVTALACAYGIGMLSWHAVERQALRLKSARPRSPRPRAQARISP